jgi:myo-inositol-1(or 4)-monophosphatase
MNYTRGFLYWCVSVAVRRNGKVLAGCVFDPEADDLYTAHIEEAAQCNSSPIHPSNIRQLKDTTLFSGITKYVNSDPQPHFDLFQRLILNTKKVRINGAAALDICHVAAGHADGFIETNLYLWDHAAAGLIAQQAGAIISVQPLPAEPHACEVICTNPHLITALQNLRTQEISCE